MSRKHRNGVDGVIFFFFQAEDGIRDYKVTGVQTCALPICAAGGAAAAAGLVAVGGAIGVVKGAIVTLAAVLAANPVTPACTWWRRPWPWCGRPAFPTRWRPAWSPRAAR